MDLSMKPRACLAARVFSVKSNVGNPDNFDDIVCELFSHLVTPSSLIFLRTPEIIEDRIPEDVTQHIGLRSPGLLRSDSLVQQPVRIQGFSNQIMPGTDENTGGHARIR